MLPLIIGTPNNGGPLSQPAGVTFIAATTDQNLRAYDTATGKQLWEADLPGGGQATPMTYAVDRRQYVAIAPEGTTSWKRRSDAIVAYALPGT